MYICNIRVCHQLKIMLIRLNVPEMYWKRSPSIKDYVNKIECPRNVLKAFSYFYEVYFYLGREKIPMR